MERILKRFLILFQSHQEEDLSDPDLQDEESGEELPQQPLQGNSHPSSATTPIPNSAPTPLTHLNSLMTSHHPHFLAKLKMDVSISPENMASTNPNYSDERVSLLMGERSTNSRSMINQINTTLSRQQQQQQQLQHQQPGDIGDVLSNKSGLEALQAAMGSGGFNLPFSFPPPAAFLAPPHHSQSQGFAAGGTNNAITSSASSHSSESSQGSGRNGGESRCRTEDGHTQNNIGTNHQQQTSWSFEEQFKQVRQASTCSVYMFSYISFRSIYTSLCLFTHIEEAEHGWGRGRGRGSRTACSVVKFGPFYIVSINAVIALS